MHKTHLYGKIEREGGVTVIRGSVSQGVARNGLILIYGAIALTALLLLSGGNLIVAVLVVLIGAALYVPLTGDQHNSAILMREIRSLLKAKDKPGQVKANVKSATASTTNPPRRPVASSKKPTTTKTSGGR